MENAGFIAAAISTGVLLTATSPGTVFAVAAAVTAATVVLIAFVRRDHRPEYGDEELAGVAHELSLGARALIFHPALRLSSLTLVLLLLFEGFADVILIALALETLHLEEGAVGFLNAAWGVGALVGGAALALMLDRGHLVAAIAGGSLLLGLATMLPGFFPEESTSYLAWFGIGIGFTFVEVAAKTLMHRLGSDETMGRRDQRRSNPAGWLAMALGSLGAIVLVELLHPDGALIVLGALMPVFVVVCWARLRAYEVGAPVAEGPYHLLRENSIFAPLPIATVERLSHDLAPVEFAAGHEVIVQGEHGDRFFLIESGRGRGLRKRRLPAQRGAGGIVRRDRPAARRAAHRHRAHHRADAAAGARARAVPHRGDRPPAQPPARRRRRRRPLGQPRNDHADGGVSVRAALALLAAALLGLGLAGPAAALTADQMYEPDAVVVVDLQLPPASVAALEAEPDEYAEGTFALASTDGTPGGVGEFSTPLTVGIRLKGEASFRDLGGKAAFKVKFNEFVKGQKFLGLKSLTLNNMVQDPSMVHEALAYAAFRAAGVPAPRTGYADVRVNGEEFGMHLNLETLDDVALERLFGGFEAPPQHLYEGEFGVDVLPGEAGEFDVDEGEEGDRSDLEALIEAVAEPSPPGFSERMAGRADLAEMAQMWALERYLGHWDGYSGRAQPHNYFLYSDPLGEFQMLPWGTDQSWTLPQLGFGPPGPVLFEACLADLACVSIYRDALRGARQMVAELDPGAEAQQLAALLEPWQDLEQAPRKPFAPDVIAAEVAAVGRFVAKRPSALAKFLGEAEPEGGSGGGNAGASSSVPGALKLSSRLPVNRAKLGRGLLPVWVNAPGPATVRLSAHIATDRGEVRACAASRTATAAGPLAIRCHLSQAVRRHLSARWLQLRVFVTVTLADQRQLTLRRAIRLPRIAA